MGDRVEFVGAVTKAAVPAALSEGDIFLNTTNVDNAPVSVVEAMACGLCVVTTSVGGIPHLIEDGRSGLLVPPDDAAAMAGAVRRVLTTEGLARRLSEDGRRIAERSDWSKVLPQWESILGRLAGAAAGEPLHRPFDLTLELMGYPLRRAGRELAALAPLGGAGLRRFQNEHRWEIARFHAEHNPAYRELLGGRLPDDWAKLPLVSKAVFQSRARVS